MAVRRRAGGARNHGAADYGRDGPPGRGAKRLGGVAVPRFRHVAGSPFGQVEEGDGTASSRRAVDAARGAPGGARRPRRRLCPGSLRPRRRAGRGRSGRGRRGGGDPAVPVGVGRRRGPRARRPDPRAGERRAAVRWRPPAGARPRDQARARAHPPASPGDGGDSPPWIGTSARSNSDWKAHLRDAIMGAWSDGEASALPRTGHAAFDALNQALGVHGATVFPRYRRRHPAPGRAGEHARGGPGVRAR